MSDLSDLHGIYPTSLRWNAESGFLTVSAFNGETGERELQPIELGQAATFVLDLATRERGYGLIKSGVYDMKLTAVSSPPPPWPENEEYKPALGCWMWNPTVGEVRLATFLSGDPMRKRSFLSSSATGPSTASKSRSATAHVRPASICWRTG